MITQHLTVEVRIGRRIGSNDLNALVLSAADDHQVGDTLVVNGWFRTISHVLHGARGVESGYVIVSLADPRVGRYREQADDAHRDNARMTRRIAALKGQITRLKRAQLLEREGRL